MKSTVFSHDFKYVLKAHLAFILVGLCLFFILIPFTTAGIPDDSIFNINTTHNQLLFRFIGDDFVTVVYAAYLVFAFLLAIFSFSFLIDLKQVTLYFSIGLSRGKLFASRYLTGLIGLFVTIFFPMTLSYVLNRKALGNCDGMGSSYLYLTFGLLLFGLIIYTLTALCTTLSGTISETLIYCLLFFFGMSVLFYVCNRLFIKLVWGNAYMAVTYLGNSVLDSFLNLTMRYNPVLFFYPNLKEHYYYYRELDSTAISYDGGFALLLWAVLLVVLILLCIMSLKKRAAEQAGTIGRKKPLIYLCMLISEFAVFAIGTLTFWEGNHVMAVIIAVFFAVIVNCLWHKALYKRALPKGKLMTISCTLTLIVPILTTCGITTIANQAASSLPDASRIQMASVTYVGNPSYLATTANGSSNDSSFYMDSQYSYENTDEIESILSLHQEMISLNMADLETDDSDFTQTVVPYDIQITYTLKDGNTKTWYYDRASLSILEDFLALDETTTVSEQIASVLDNSLEESTPSSTAFAEGDIYLSDIWFSDPCYLDITDEARGQLLSALKTDLLSMSVEERYFPDEDALGVLFFTTSGETDLDTFAYHLGNASVYITSAYTNTIAFLEENHLMDLMTFEGEIESITLQEYDPYGGVVNGRTEPLSNLFLSYKSDDVDSFVVKEDFGSKQAITDPDQISELVSQMRSVYNMTRSGYLAAVKISGSDDYIYKYLPM
ncbi:MAG: hypothetical protein K6G01_08895 [Eubacterium sp.]|nr:hypothetical protein [Eubacterium sp.]